MLPIEPDDIRTIFPEFIDTEDDKISFYIEAARDYVNEGRWGSSKARRGVILMTAHMLARSASEDGNTGAILSESVGGISTTYAAPGGSTDGSALALTSYGEQFEMLRRTVVKTPLVT